MNLHHSAIWMAGLYLLLLMQFLENKVSVDLTRSEFVEAQLVGSQVCTFVIFSNVDFSLIYMPLLVYMLLLSGVVCLDFVS